MAWAKAHDWVAESNGRDLTFYIVLAAVGRRKATRTPVMHGTWPTFAARLMASQLIRKTPEGWVIDPA
jgi:hypothetical protein